MFYLLHRSSTMLSIIEVDADRDTAFERTQRLSRQHPRDEVLLLDVVLRCFPHDLMVPTHE